VIRHIAPPAGAKIPVPGQGTWHRAEVRERRKAEIGALRLGFDLGMTLIDTAEMYAEGGTERLVGDAISGCRDGVFLMPLWPTIESFVELKERGGNAAAAAIRLSRQDPTELDLAFPPPIKVRPLQAPLRTP
jgi:predicted aldo/keto reductase-like oxidoreductase